MSTQKKTCTQKHTKNIFIFSHLQHKGQVKEGYMERKAKVHRKENSSIQPCEIGSWQK